MLAASLDERELVKEAAGKVQEKIGGVVGSKTQETKGRAKEVEGTAQRKVGDAKER